LQQIFHISILLQKYVFFLTFFLVKHRGNFFFQVTGHTGEDELHTALQDAKIVVIPAGLPRKPGMTRDDLFVTNASIVHKLAQACAKYSPNAHILVISNPINSTVPILAEIFRMAGVYDPKRVFGVTTLDVVRASTFSGELKHVDPRLMDVTVVGGHAGTTILPLFSQLKGYSFTQNELDELTYRVQFGGDEVVKAKAGTGSATLSMALAGARFTNSLIDALTGKTGVSECGFVESDTTPTRFFASRIEFDVSQNPPYPLS
jgi:malate dehydrogenase